MNQHLHSTAGILDLTATAAIAEIQSGHLSPLDVVDASIARIEATDPVINALPVRCFEDARATARRWMEETAKSGIWPPLAGLPLAVKDNTDVAGVPTSGGSALTAGRVPEVSDPAIQRLQRAGAIVVAKSNLCELGGGNSTNALFGATRNPLFPALTPGGSSGGSAAALAARQVFLAQGNDVGGSLRTPAAFCGVAGFRPTPGLVPRKPLSDPFDTIFVEGPMARSIPDLALMLDAMAGFHAADLFSRPRSTSFFDVAQQPHWAMRVAVSEDLDLLPISRDIRSDFRAALDKLQRAGCAIREDSPDLSGAPEVIKTLRALNYFTVWGAFWPKSATKFTPEVAGDIARGERLTAPEIARAVDHRAVLYRRMTAFFEEFDILICPTTPLRPFPVEISWPTAIDGAACESYVDWILVTYIWSILGCPAAAVPAGHTAEGVPVSLQVIGPPHADARVLAVAARIEQEFAPQA